MAYQNLRNLVQQQGRSQDILNTQKPLGPQATAQNQQQTQNQSQGLTGDISSTISAGDAGQQQGDPSIAGQGAVEGNQGGSLLAENLGAASKIDVSSPTKQGIAETQKGLMSEEDAFNKSLNEYTKKYEDFGKVYGSDYNKLFEGAVKGDQKALTLSQNILKDSGFKYVPTQDYAQQAQNQINQLTSKGGLESSLASQNVGTGYNSRMAALDSQALKQSGQLGRQLNSLNQQVTDLKNTQERMGSNVNMSSTKKGLGEIATDWMKNTKKAQEDESQNWYKIAQQNAQAQQADFERRKQANLNAIRGQIDSASQAAQLKYKSQDQANRVKTQADELQKAWNTASGQQYVAPNVSQRYYTDFIDQTEAEQWNRIRNLLGSTENEWTAGSRPQDIAAQSNYNDIAYKNFDNSGLEGMTQQEAETWVAQENAAIAERNRQAQMAYQQQQMIQQQQAAQYAAQQAAIQAQQQAQQQQSIFQGGSPFSGGGSSSMWNPPKSAYTGPVYTPPPPPKPTPAPAQTANKKPADLSKISTGINIGPTGLGGNWRSM